MALRSAYLPLHVEFDDFLFAAIGEESNGMPLTVMSALTRLDFDPWEKAAQLSGLTAKEAIQTLASLLAGLPVGRWDLKDTSTIAARLVALLPKRGSPGQRKDGEAQSAGRFSIRTVLWLVCLTLLVLALLGLMQNSGSQRTEGGASSVTSHVSSPPFDQ